MTFSDFVKKDCSLSNEGIGLEIGPLFRPIIEKTNYNVSYADHMTTEGLKEKYRYDPRVDIERICNVDFDLSKFTLPELISKHSLDYVVAAHVIEHIPDVVSWLQTLAVLLKDTGSLFLSIPDKRFCFDFSRKLTTAEDLIFSYNEKRQKPTQAQVRDHFENLQHISCFLSWSIPWVYSLRSPKSYYTPAEVKQAVIYSQSNYSDVHCWTWTSSSFLLIMQTLTQHDLVQFYINKFIETQPNSLEFYVELKKGPEAKVNQDKLLSYFRAKNNLNWSNAEKLPEYAFVKSLGQKLQSVFFDKK